MRFIMFLDVYCVLVESEDGSEYCNRGLTVKVEKTVAIHID